MKAAIYSILFFSVAWSGFADIVAGPFRNEHNGHLYYLVAANTWTNSEAEAVTLGGHLATINDAAENEWVVNIFGTYGGQARPLWIGLTDRDAEGTFRWVSGQEFTFANWNVATAEPNNSGGGGYEEDFVYIVQNNSGNPDVLATFWNDVPNDGYGVISPIYGVVEVESAAPPTPVVYGSQVCWQTAANVTYQLQWRPANSRGSWVKFGPPVEGTGGIACVSGHPQPGHGRLYRVLVLD